MAVLTARQKAELRNGLERSAPGNEINYDKTQVGQAFQAIEDFISSNTAKLSGLIDAATSPFVFTPAQKKFMFAYWADQKFRRDK